jgi:CelD/BcsL family acetyltransferase involved in cellulose biosynthesis
MLLLRRDFEGLYAEKRSGETRRGNRKRDARLAQCGDVKFGLPESPDEAHKLLDQMFIHQESRLAESGIHGVFGAAEREFVHRLADIDNVLLPYYLTINGELAAMMLGGKFDGTFWALISSLNPKLARKHSPGDAALRKMIEACCISGLRCLDLSSGDTPYKFHWADKAIPLREAIHFLTLRGAVWSLGAFGAALSKRIIKQSPTLWPLYQRLRAGLRGRGPAYAEAARN